MDARELLTENLALLERVIAFTCRRHRLQDDEAEEFAAFVRLRLVEDDYAVLRKFEGRSSLATFLAVVVQRLLLDHRIHLWGKWHASAEAKRLGPLAVEIERLVFRDGRTVDEALPLLRSANPSVTRESVEALLQRLPRRTPRRRFVGLEEAESVASPIGQADERADEVDRERRSMRVSEIVTRFVAAMPPGERLVLQLRFDGGMTVAEIARSLHLDQRSLYRTIEKRLRELRERLEEDGIDSSEVDDLIGSRGTVLDFHLRNGTARPSIAREGVREDLSP